MLLKPNIIILLVLLVLLAVACDSGISGEAFDNRPPDTQLSVRDDSLLDNLSEDDRLVSTVRITWTGDDPDGFVKGYEVRFLDQMGDIEGVAWSFTETTDSLFLLPIRQGDRISDVVFEVRAVDDDGLADPTPARTIYPIQNSPPDIRLSPFDLPPDTTFNVMSIGWVAEDPDGNANLERIDVSFNDSLNFVALPPEISFATFVLPQTNPGASGEIVDAEVFLGRGFEQTGISVPGVRIGEMNTLYVRAADQTDTTSVRIEYSWFVKGKTSNVLYVNDFRRATHPVVSTFHLNVLNEYLPAGTPIDIWDITTPYTTGSSGNFPRSGLLPPTAQPALDRFFRGYDYIYWVASATTDQIVGNNLPFAAPVLEPFFENGGKMMVHSPIQLPVDPDEIATNAATLLLPLNSLTQFPDSLRQTLRLLGNAPVSARDPLPGVATALPALKMNGFVINTLPYVATSSATIPLYDAQFQYVTRVGNRRGIWSGSSTIASMSDDRRVGLFTIPLINEANGTPLVIGEDGNPQTARDAVKLMLESLGFPK
ncbi:MAG: hypothetical protein HOC28_11960 [Bacteroidetes Order II. Incertae sedis bacterium]|jgi:hypothetical protein|nr:hypothetical protein [Bacteroidetes Order II. bacterium]MBT4603840.1 hypothetical protein [Bacteroidetes Order II. bacterium]MBT5248698.1 hypothetical protein [Bacteroidetes Order II. bacterium]MBT6201636.1 hypothetical protein [Bacteroidetes Order II. bacterium]MBT6425472.1 hypothetical protein [Bacteroidetes Order II. bacterium]